MAFRQPRRQLTIELNDNRVPPKKWGGALGPFLGALIGSTVTVYLVQQLLPTEFIRGTRYDCNFNSTGSYFPIAEGKGVYSFVFFANEHGKVVLSLTTSPIANIPSKNTQQKEDKAKDYHPKFEICSNPILKNGISCDDKYWETVSSREMLESTKYLVKLESGVTLRAAVVDAEKAKENSNPAIAGKQIRLISEKFGNFTINPITIMSCSVIS